MVHGEDYKVDLKVKGENSEQNYIIIPMKKLGLDKCLVIFDQ